MSYAKKMGKKIGRNISKNLNGKYNQKRLDRAKQSDTNAFKTSSKEQFKKHLLNWLAIKLLIKLWRFQKSSQQKKKSERVTNENDKEIPKERYESPEERQKIIDDLRLI